MKYIALFAAFLLPLAASAAQISVPSAPAAAYGLISVSGGQYVASTTRPLIAGTGITFTGGTPYVFGPSITISAAAGGGAGGTFSTSTAFGSTLNNYSNNATDVVEFGGISGTTTAKYWFDPNSQVSYLAGSVGIGTTSPSAQLSIDGGTGPNNVRVCQGVGNGCVQMGFTASGNQAATIGTTFNGGLFFITNSATRMNISSTGNVGIATTTSQWPLESVSTTKPQLDLYSGSTDNHWAIRAVSGGTLYFSTTTYTGTSTTAALIIDPNGYLVNPVIASGSGSNCLQVDTTGKITNTGAACASGSGSGTVSTSTNEIGGRLPYWTSNSGTPATLGQVATTTLAFSGPFTGAGSIGTLVGGANTTILYTGLATTSQPALSSLLYSTGGTGVAGVATTSETCSTGISCTAHAVLTGGGAITLATMNAGVLASDLNGAVPTSHATSTLFGSGTPGQVLMLSNGGLVFAATSSVAAGSASTTLLADTNTWSGLDKFANASSSLFTLIGAADGCAQFTTSGMLSSTGSACGAGGSANSKFATSSSTLFPNAIYVNGGTSTLVGIGTTTPSAMLTIASTTGTQLLLSEGAANPGWSFRTVGTTLYLSTTSPTSFATTSSMWNITSAGKINFGESGSFVYDNTTGSTTIPLLIAGNPSTLPSAGVINAFDMPQGAVTAGTLESGCFGFCTAGASATSSLTIWGLATGIVGGIKNVAVSIGTSTQPTASGQDSRATHVQFSGAVSTTTVSCMSQGGVGCQYIFKDTQGGTCTELTTQGGVGTFKAVTCPTN